MAATQNFERTRRGTDFASHIVKSLVSACERSTSHGRADCPDARRGAAPLRLCRLAFMKVDGWHIRQARWLISIEIGLIDYTIGQCVGTGIDLRLCLFAASPTERGGPSPKFQHSSGADVFPVLSSARACRADSDPVRTHDGATHAVANRSAIDLTKRRGFFAGARSRRAGRAPS